MEDILILLVKFLYEQKRMHMCTFCNLQLNVRQSFWFMPKNLKNGQLLPIIGTFKSFFINKSKILADTEPQHYG